MTGLRLGGKTGLIIVTVLVGAGITALAVGARVWGKSRAVTEVRVEGHHLLEEGGLVQQSGVRPGTPLFEVDLFAVRKRMLEEPFVRDAVVRRDALGAIVIVVTERTPVAAIASIPMRLVDEGGWVLPTAPAGKVVDVPVLSGDLGLNGAKPGKRVTSPGLARALEMADVLRKSQGANMRVSEVRVRDNGEVVLFTAEGGVPVFAGTGRFASRVEAFDAFWEQIVLRGEVRQLRMVDLRYEGQVIVRWNPVTRQNS